MTNETPTIDDKPEVVAGLLAEFKAPDELVAGASKVKDAGFTRWDCHSPFPVHGIDPAMGIRPTILPWLVLGAGATGVIVALLMQWWTNAVDYPLNISGKPLFSIPANIPVTFELLILFSALTAFVGVILLNNLPRLNHPLLANERFRRATDDKFFISIAAADPKFNESTTRELLESLAAVEVVEPYFESRTSAKVPTAFHIIGAFSALLALIPFLLIAQARATKSSVPRLHLWPDMDYQAKFKTQTENSIFGDGRTMRQPVEGTIAVGQLQEETRFFEGREGEHWVTDIPMEVTPQLVARGRERFDIYCAVCHGLTGEGDGIVSLRAIEREDPTWIKPLSIHAEAVCTQPIGQIYGTISNGIRSMPAYGPQISPEDRWAIVLYVKALQRSQNATIDDVPRDQRAELQ
jgi:mono/diheme cytochrome c family protein